ncbi:PTS transporter subunit EIIA [Roseomonas terrae]|jgi:PTS system nitrogen regulatory IIA component|uniref:PTS transporter subunit EIIA n=1 Tax=Neoroseomonas terrae TaxID=424799 RepID=A0ABS5EJL8_9PROT|nr:PTS sugar transporter subunit IIA [Neoroseomonas terrae]MBR0651223.1 PTS transporter subunit EIIA [Neoroseomonas terrae]
MAMSHRISADDVVLDLSAGSKRAVLKLLAEEAARRLGRDEAEILAALTDREALGSTGLGRGIALPHARLPGDQPPLVLFVRLQRPIDWEARDDEPVDLVILVLWPEASADGFLPALSDTCRGLRNPQALRSLRSAASAEEAATLLDRYNQAPPAEAEDA